MTDDKKMVINMVTDYSVSDIKEIINQHPERICFVASDFEEVWKKYDIKRNQFVYKLAKPDSVIRTSISTMVCGDVSLSVTPIAYPVVKDQN